jgi:hypothetical protein
LSRRRRAGKGAQMTAILFVGNSYIARNNLPRLVQQLWKADQNEDIDVDQTTPGGCSLDRHLRGDAMTKIASKRFNYVVLQEQSRLPVWGRERMLESVREMGKAIEAVDAIPVLYMTWARAYAPEEQEPLADAYTHAAAIIDGMLAPVGLAWIDAKPIVELYDRDGSHPTLAGSYLAALIIYATITGRMTSGLPPLGVMQANELQTITDRVVTAFRGSA